ncbi:hypothetical protein PO124_03735 [Bacillus licheniformis]|nr:hypothetical protein [Bacillus licheniformis]
MMKFRKWTAKRKGKTVNEATAMIRGKKARMSNLFSTGKASAKSMLRLSAIRFRSKRFIPNDRRQYR